MKQCAAATFAVGLLVTAAGSAGAQERPEPFLLLEVARPCATEEQDEVLAEELELRMPSAFLVRGSVGGVEPDWRVAWRPLPSGQCELVFSSSDNSSTMALGPEASTAEIQLAASRVAWLASISPPIEAVVAVESLPDEAQPAIEEPEPTLTPEPEPESEPEPEPEPEPDPEPPAQSPYETIDTKVSLLPSAVLYPRPLPQNHAPRLSLNLVAGTSYGLEGLELGGVFNRETEFARGVQVALGANLVDKDARVVQVALGFNRVGGAQQGAQVALGANIAGAGRGLQLALGGNLAASMSGLQMSLVNLAGPVEGAQIGLVNVARTSDVSLGLVNILYGEPLYFTTWATSIGGAVLGLQHGGKYVRYAYLGGVDAGLPTPTGKLGVGLGGHLPLGPLFVDGDLLVFWVVPFGEPINRVSLQPQLKASLGWQIARRFAVFAGVSATGLWSGLADPTAIVPAGADEIPLGSTTTRFFTWPELHAGVRF